MRKQEIINKLKIEALAQKAEELERKIKETYRLIFGLPTLFLSALILYEIFTIGNKIAYAVDFSVFEGIILLITAAIIILALGFVNIIMWSGVIWE